MTNYELHQQEQIEARAQEAHRIFTEHMAKIDADYERSIRRIERDTRLMQWIITVVVLILFLTGLLAIIFK